MAVGEIISVKPDAVRFLTHPSHSSWDVSWVRVRPASCIFALRRLTGSKNGVQDGLGTVTTIPTNASHFLSRSFFKSSSKSFGNYLLDFFESFRFL